MRIWTAARGWTAARSGAERGLAVAACLLGLAGPAGATSMIELAWTASGSSTVSASPGANLTLQILLLPDADGVSSYAVSIEFDRDGANELDLVDVRTFLPPGFDVPFALGPQQESGAGTPGSVLSFGAGTVANGPTSGSLLIGEIDFLVTANVASDGPDVFSGLFNDGVDDVFDNEGSEAGVAFGEAAVNVPEPAVGLVLLPLALAAMRRAL